jgi:hypothetical protein
MQSGLRWEAIIEYSGKAEVRLKALGDGVKELFFY